MNDKAIRNILIAYLKASNHEIRIYQEKSISSASVGRQLICMISPS